MARKTRQRSGRPDVSPPTASQLPSADKLPERSVRMAAVAMAAAAFIIYALTTRRGLAGGDSGELTIVSSTWGIAHPPGYPLFTLVGQVFSALPFGSVAFRINLVSAVFDALAVGLLCAAVSRWRNHVAAGVLAACLFAFSPLVWTYANAAEIFSLNNFFAAGLLWLTVAFAQQPRTKLAYVGAVWSGLGIGNHQTLLFLALPCVVWVLTVGGPTLRRPRVLATLLGLGMLAGLLPYTYLLAAAQRIPLMGWGDTSHLQGFIHHVLRGDYGTFRLSSGAAGGEAALLHRLWIYLKTWPTEFLGGVWLLAVGGIGVCMRDRRDSIAKLWLFSLVFYVLVFNIFNNARVDTQLSLGVQERFYQQANLLVCAFAGAGLLALATYARQLKLALPAACLVGVLQVGLHYTTLNRADSHLFEDLGRNILKDLPPNAILINQGDHTIGALRYLQMIDNERPDVWVIDAGALSFAWSKRWVRGNFPGLVLPGDGMYADTGYQLKDLIAANSLRHPFFLLNVQAPWDKDSLAQAYKNWPFGFSRRLLPPNEKPDIDAWLRVNEAAFSSFDVSRTDAFASTSWESYTAWQYWNELRYFGTELLLRGIDGEREEQLLTLGTQALERVAQAGILEDPWVYKNLGLGYRYLSKYDASYNARMLQAWKQFLEMGVPENPEIVTIRAIVAQAESATK